MSKNSDSHSMKNIDQIENSIEIINSKPGPMPGVAKKTAPKELVLGQND